MNKIMVVLIAVVLSGCASIKGDEGALIGGSAGALFGGSPRAKAVSMAVGTLIGYDIGRSFDPKEPQRQRQSYSLHTRPRGGYGYDGAQQVVGYDQNGQPMCYDNRSGGQQISCRFLAENPYYECCGKFGNVQPAVQQASYQQGGVFVQKGRERVASASSATEKTSSAYDGPTAGNYMSGGWDYLIPPDCRTPNVGRNSQCLEEEVVAFKRLQSACLKDKTQCTGDFARAAFYDDHLAKELRSSESKWAVK